VTGHVKLNEPGAEGHWYTKEDVEEEEEEDEEDGQVRFTGCPRKVHFATPRLANILVYFRTGAEFKS